MIEIIKWVKQIFICSILSDIVIHIMPSKKYEKYAEFLCGLLIVIICIEPVCKLYGQNISVETIYKDIISDEKRMQIKQNTYDGDSDSQNKIVSEYKKELEKKVEEVVFKNNYDPLSTTVEINTDKNSSEYCKIQKINIYISKNQEKSSNILIDKIKVDLKLDDKAGEEQDNSDKYDELRKKICEEFKVDLEQINISEIK